ncbi:MAG: fructose-6-phosphate aldolase [Bdellovibrionales bacterium]|nr:fructose-6-phosphate aldolase [Bdellovibrionales bacterium]
MNFFLDTAHIDEIKKAQKWNLIDGVTTNPSLVAQTNYSHKELILEICNLLKDKPVSAEVLSVSSEKIYKEAKELAKIHPSVVVKIPLIAEGLKAVKKLHAENIATNVTLCFSPNQALLAAKAGATYISVFVGRLDDIGHEGCEIASQCHKLMKEYQYKSQILGASIRHSKHIFTLAQAGIPISTLPFKVFNQLIQHPLTDIGLKKFLEDAKKSKHLP